VPKTTNNKIICIVEQFKTQEYNFFFFNYVRQNNEIVFFKHLFLTKFELEILYKNKLGKAIFIFLGCYKKTVYGVNSLLHFLALVFKI
jgi:hypothetical protein